MEHFYRSIHGWSRFVPFYAEAVKAAPRYGAHFVEVGAWKGKSASYMAVEIINSGKEIKFDVVDTWKGSDEPAHHSDPDVQNGTLFEAFLKNTLPVKRAINPLRMLSTEAAKRYKDESLDFVLLDASHDYENVKADIEAYWPKIKKGGVLAGDDYRWAGVTKAVNEFVEHEGLKLILNERGVCWKVVK